MTNLSLQNCVLFPDASVHPEEENASPASLPGELAPTALPRPWYFLAHWAHPVSQWLSTKSDFDFALKGHL